MRKFRIVTFALLLALVLLVLPLGACAEERVVTAVDADSIQKMLDINKDGKGLTLIIPEGTYELSNGLTVYSNTKIIANENARIVRNYDKARTLLISEREEGIGYSASSGISIEGGVWDLNISKYPVSGDTALCAFVFVHAQDITVKDAVLKNSYNGHLIALEGVKNANIINCEFSGYKGYKGSENEAIQLDIVHDETTIDGLDKSLYDDAACDNILVEGCTISDYSTGVGSHLAVEGVYHKNIKIKNNKFSNLSSEAVKALNYKNIEVAGNTIDKCEDGIKVYTLNTGTNFVKPLPGTDIESKPENGDYGVKITQNKITNLRGLSVCGGVRIMGNPSKDASKNRPISGAIVQGNTVSGTDNGGILIEYAPSAIVQSNAVSNVKNNGIFLSESSNVKIEGNTLKDVGKNGISVYDNSSGVSVGKNSLSGVGNHALAVYDSQNVRTLSNKIFGCGGNGITFVNAPKGNIQANKLKAGVKGINVEKSSDTTIQSNAVYAAGEHGIGVYKSSNNCRVYKNQLSGHKGHGISIYEKCNNVSIESNKIAMKTADKSGIVVNGSAGAAVKSNSVTGKCARAVNISPETTGSNVTTMQSLTADLAFTGIFGTCAKGTTVWATIGKTKYSGKVTDSKYQINFTLPVSGTKITVCEQDKAKNLYYTSVVV